MHNSFVRNVWQYLLDLNIHIPCDPEILLQDTAKKMSVYTRQNTCRMIMQCYLE